MNKYLALAATVGAVLLLLTVPTACGVYSFTGTSTDAKNISIQEFYNNSDLGPANLGQDFTNRIKDYFVQNSTLSVVPEDGELQLEGEITNYTFTPIAPTASEDVNGLNTASSTRLTITVKATYVNTLDESMSFKDKSFSFYADFPNDQDITDIEDNLIRQISDRIINDIFNASVANW